MNSQMKYLVFANQARMNSETTTDAVMRRHFINMAGKWQILADFAATPAAYTAAVDRRDGGLPAH